MKLQREKSAKRKNTVLNQRLQNGHILGMDSHSFHLCLFACAILISASIIALKFRSVRPRSQQRTAAVSPIGRIAEVDLPVAEELVDGPVVRTDIGPVFVNLSSTTEYVQAKVRVEINVDELQRQLTENQQHSLQREQVRVDAFPIIWSNKYVRRGVEPKEISRFIAIRKNRMQDLFISSLSSRKLDNIQGSSGLSKLKTELLGLFNEAFEVEKPVINQVYIEHFQIF